MKNGPSFEERLRRQPLKAAPPEWRAEILAAASQAAPARATTNTCWGATLRRQLSAILHPYPKAWATLAVTWVVILILHLAAREPSPVAVARNQEPSPETTTELRQQKKLLAELLGANEPSAADREPVLAPKPRSQRSRIIAA